MSKEYQITLLDGEGFELSSTIATNLPSAIDQAKYYLSDLFAARIKTTHYQLGPYKAEVTLNGVCVRDFFK